jgi:hypothetical protein
MYYNYKLFKYILKLKIEQERMDYNDATGNVELNRNKSANDYSGPNMVQMGPILKHSLSVVERQNDIKAKLKRIFSKIDESTLNWSLNSW